MSIHGQGAGSTILVPMSDFDFSTCTFSGAIAGKGCFFSITELILSAFSIWGGGASLTGTTHDNVLVNWSLGTQAHDVSFSGFGASSTNLVGIAMNWLRAHNLVCDGFGKTCEEAVNGVSSLYFNFAGDTAGPNLVIDAASVDDFGGQYGLTTGTVLIKLNSPTAAYSFFGGPNSGIFTACTVINCTAIYIVGAGGVANLDGGKWGSAAAGSNAIYLGNAATVVHSKNATLTGAAAGGCLNSVAGSRFFDQGGNTCNGAPVGTTTIFGDASITGVALATGNIALTSGWDSSTKTGISGSTRAGQFEIDATGTPTLGPVITITFPVPFWVTPSGGCKMQQIGGTGVILDVTTGTVTATTAAFTVQGTPVAGLTYIFQYTCSNP